MTIEQAEHFASDWIAAWNSHDLSAIMTHYADEVAFSSPFIPLLKFNDTGIINGKSELSKYFQIGLEAYPELHFKLHNVFAGIDTVVLYYESVNGRMAAEVFQLDGHGKAIRVFCNYTNNKSRY